MSLVFDHNGTSFSVATEALKAKGLVRLPDRSHVKLEGTAAEPRAVAIKNLAPTIDDDVFPAQAVG